MDVPVVTKDMVIGDAVRVHPVVAEVLFEAGIHCVACGVAQFETLEEGLARHGLDEEAIEALLGKINALLKKEFDE